MGIEKHGVKFIIRARECHRLDLTHTLTLGRQGLHVSEEELLRHAQGCDTAAMLRSRFCEDFLRYLGAQQVDSMDASAYEGATIVHDLNQPIDQSLHGKYTTIIDGGTQEHVLNITQSLTNAINLLAPGGHLLMMTPTNNYCGHGFYQFSPELFDSVMGPHNGMELVEMIACECFEDETRWFKVARPSVIGRRVMLRSHFCVLLLVIARRIGNEPVEKITAMQSDYSAAWDDSAKAESIHRQNGGKTGLCGLLKKALKRMARKMVYSNRLELDREAFSEIVD
jgi:hypothetical protein